MNRAILTRLQQARREKRAVALATALDDGRQALVIDGAVEGVLELTPSQLRRIEAALREDRSGPLEPVDGNGEARLFVQVFSPPLRLVVVGAVHIAQALAPMAELAGYEVILVDPRSGWANAARFPGLRIVGDWPDEALAALDLDRRTAVVVLAHDPKLDDPALSQALASDAFYIGALGSRRTQAKRLERLAAQGFTPADLERIHGPVGLAIGARSPAEIAVAILAEITQARHRKTAAMPAS